MIPTHLLTSPNYTNTYVYLLINVRSQSLLGKFPFSGFYYIVPIATHVISFVTIIINANLNEMNAIPQSSTEFVMNSDMYFFYFDKS